MKKIWALICGLAIMETSLFSGVNVNVYAEETATEEAKTEAIVEDSAENGISEDELPEEYAESIEIPIDFAKLQKSNADIYAWITVPGTLVDYPVLQHPEQDGFYLEHGLDKEYLFNGCIYTEKRNNKDFSDFNTVMYGHNMRDGSMFGSLHRFHDKQFFDEHREILVYTPEHILHYTIFAAYKYDNRHILNWWNFEQTFPEEEARKAAEEAEAAETAGTETTDTKTIENNQNTDSAKAISVPETIEKTKATTTEASEDMGLEETDTIEEIDLELLKKQVEQRKIYLTDLYAIENTPALFTETPIATPKDRILTLSTCINDENYRYLVQGILTNAECSHPHTSSTYCPKKEDPLAPLIDEILQPTPTPQPTPTKAPTNK